jgi:murein L,D-transpeptidase YcbB/YkuD
MILDGWTRRGVLAAACAALASLPARAAGPEPRTGDDGDGLAGAAVSEVLRSEVHPWLGRADLRDVAVDLRALYPPGSGSLFWFDGSRPSAALLSGTATLRAADARGLDPGRYDAALLEEEAQRAAAGAPLSPRDRALLDVAVTAGFLRHLSDAHRGCAPAGKAGRVGLPERRLDRPALLREARASGRPDDVVARVEPRHAGYARLKEALARQRARPPPPRLPELPRSGKVSPGDAWDGIPAMRALLASLGDLPSGQAGEAPADATVLDGALAAALKRFQERHGLAADGVVGKGTRAAMEIAPETRARQIELALERWRWLPDPGRRVVLVELPLAELSAIEPGRADLDLRMKVVIGESRRHATPMFTAPLTAVVFRPYWIPPPRILREEVLPAARKKPGWLEKRGMEIVATPEAGAPPLAPTDEVLARVERGELVIRQRPGPRNDLGAVKFVVQDPQCIALHGTPHGRLFELARRDRSHGCIRLEHPDALAAWVLRDEPGWDAARIAGAQGEDRTTWVRLREPIPVLFLYATAAVDRDGTEHYVGDIYGQDAVLEAALGAGVAAPRTRGAR